jgi:hypothetical protein
MSIATFIVFSTCNIITQAWVWYLIWRSARQWQLKIAELMYQLEEQERKLTTLKALSTGHPAPLSGARPWRQD